MLVRLAVAIDAIDPPPRRRVGRESGRPWSFLRPCGTSSATTPGAAPLAAMADARAGAAPRRGPGWMVWLAEGRRATAARQAPVVRRWPGRRWPGRGCPRVGAGR